MEANHASDAVVAVVRMYTGLLGDKQNEVLMLRAEIAKGEGFFARIGQALESKAKVVLRVGSFEEVAQLVGAQLDAGAEAAAVLFDAAAREGKVTAALREALVFAGAYEPSADHATLVQLVARVSKAIVDMKAETLPSIAGIEGSTGLRELVLAASAWAVCSSPSASRPKVSRLWAAARAIGPAAVERLEREQAVLKAARSYGATGGNDNGTGSFARSVLREAAINLAALDLKPV